MTGWTGGPLTAALTLVNVILVVVNLARVRFDLAALNLAAVALLVAVYARSRA